ncbi:MAG: nuclear transport factor 2 family protein [Acidimicrobiales bacterium]|jgi:hypothetical protein|nr:nuclear transport factor 2 family protein [Acidimicrobiales bacterium]
MNPIEVATAYLDALVRRDPSGVPLTADVRRVVNGQASAAGDDALRESIRHEPPFTIAPDRRWIVGSDELVAFYDLSAEVGDGAPIPVTVGERFEFRDGLISEIEAVHITTPGPPLGWLDGVAEGAADEGVVPAVRAYLDALVSHEAGAVLLADDVRRVENGNLTGEGSDDLRTSLESEIMQMVQGISDERWVIAGDSAAVFYNLSAGSPGDVMPVLIAERFRTNGGVLTEIEAIFATPSS